MIVQCDSIDQPIDHDRGTIIGDTIGDFQWYDENIMIGFTEDTIDLFDIVIPVILHNEGDRYVHDTSINEVSRMGITLATYRQYYGRGNNNSIKTLTSEEAQCIYRELFWNKNNLDSIVNLGYRRTTAVLFDSEINIGPSRANRFFQKSLGMPVSERTGRIDENTISYLKQTDKTDDELCDLVLSERRQYYSRLVRRNSVYARYHRGWNNRIEHMRNFVKEV